MNIGQNIRTLRKQKGYSQQQLADMINESCSTALKRNSISNYESGISNPKAEVLRELVNIFGITFDVLLGDHLQEAGKGDHELAHTASKIEDYKNTAEQGVFGLMQRSRTIGEEMASANPQGKDALLRELLQINEALTAKVMELYEKNMKAIEFINAHKMGDE